MTDRKRHARSEGIFQHCSLVTAPKGNAKASGSDLIFLGVGAWRGGSCVPSCVQGCEASALEKSRCVSLAWEGNERSQNHFLLRG